jgi:hypothetical protein
VTQPAKRRKRRDIQPPPHYTTPGSPEGYITWCWRKPVISLAVDCHRVDCYVFVKAQGTIRIGTYGRKGTDKNRLN